MAIRVEEIQSRAGAVDLDRDRQLVLRFQSGDRAAFDDLYRRYHARLLAYCTRRVGDRHAAEELAQEAFLRALRAMPRFAGERRFYPWMTVIAGRLCIDYHRRNARIEPAPDIDTGVQEADHTELFAAVDRQLLDTALARLAPRHREIIDLRERRGWSYNRIADHLQVPLTTVEALLHRARKALRREFLAVTAELPEPVTPRRAHGFAGFIGLAGVVERIRFWATSIGVERLVPAAGAAAAGVAAIGLAVAPVVTDHPSDEATTVEAPSSTVTSTAGPAATAAADPALAGTTGAAVAPDAGRAAAPADAGLPAGTISLGQAAAVYTGDAGQAYLDERMAEMLIQVELPVIGEVAFEPPAPLKPLLEPLLPAELTNPEIP
jgi:RNA polymerase sigma-70 factor (ECF subfamily)